MVLLCDDDGCSCENNGMCPCTIDLKDGFDKLAATVVGQLTSPHGDGHSFNNCTVDASLLIPFTFLIPRHAPSLSSTCCVLLLPLELQRLRSNSRVNSWYATSPYGALGSCVFSRSHCWHYYSSRLRHCQVAPERLRSPWCRGLSWPGRVGCRRTGGGLRRVCARVHRRLRV